MECSLCTNESMKSNYPDEGNGWIAIPNNVSVFLCPECAKTYNTSSEPDQRDMLSKAWR
jgi:hypothetical protein